MRFLARAASISIEGKRESMFISRRVILTSFWLLLANKLCKVALANGHYALGGVWALVSISLMFKVPVLLSFFGLVMDCLNGP